MDSEKNSQSLSKVSTSGEPVQQEGHVEELQRNFSVWSLGSLCLCLMATWEALGSVVAQALVSGGAPCLFYNYVISFIGTIAVAMSLAEISSIYPTAGGQYHWVAELAPAKHKAIASWFTGWISIGGQICLTASAALAGGLQYRGIVSLDIATYNPQRWQGMLFYWAVLAYALIVNVWGVKILPATNTVAGVLHITGFAAIFIVMAVMAPKHDAHYVFVETINETGWDNDGVAWMIGLVSTVYPFLGYDAAAHLAEELPNPSKYVPIAMVGSILVNGVIGLAYCLMLLFSLGDLNTLLASTTGFPFIQLFYDVCRSKAGASILTIIPTLIATMANAAGLTSTSRTFWAFARDGAIPASGWFAHVDANLSIPVRMVLVVSLLEFLLGLIYLASSTAFNAVLSMSILGMYMSYILPIIYMFLYGRGKTGPQMGPFKMGRTTGKLVNAFAIVWLAFAMFWSTWPNFYPVTAENMNYSTVVLAAWVAIGSVYYLGWGRKSYTGPVKFVDSMLRT